MSVVVAIPKDGVIYFGADTQTTMDNTKYQITDEHLLKLHIIGNWVVGSCGNCASIQIGLNILNQLKDLPLTKNMLVNEFMPRFIKEAKDRNLIFSSESIEKNQMAFPSLLIGCKDKLYAINGCSIFKAVTPYSIGTGGMYLLNSINYDNQNLDVNDIIADAIRKYGSTNLYVNKGVTFANTSDLKLEVLYDNSL